MNFFISFTCADDSKEPYQESCTETDLFKYVGIDMAKSIIAQTAFCQIGLTVVTILDLETIKVTYTK